MNAVEKLFDLDDRRFYGLVGASVLLVLAAVLSFVLIPQIKSYHKEQKTQAALPAMSHQGTDFQQLLQQRDMDISERAKLLHGDM